MEWSASGSGETKEPFWSADLGVVGEPEEPFWRVELLVVKEPKELYWRVELVLKRGLKSYCRALT